MTKLDLLKDWYQRIWIDGDLDAIDSFFAPASAASGLVADLAVGPDDFRALIPAILRLIREPTFSIDRHLDAGDWLWALVVVKAKAAGSMADVVVPGQVMMRVENGKIVEAFNQFDFLALFEQLDLLPPNAFMLCLSGEALH